MRRSMARRNGISFIQRAYRAGRKTATRNQTTGESLTDLVKINAAWVNYRRNRNVKAQAWKRYFAEMSAFLRGYNSRMKQSVRNAVLLPTRKTVGAVVTAMNEAITLEQLLGQLNRLPLSELIVVVNGSSDATFDVARRLGATVVHYPEALGHDVGRAVGAKLCTSDIVLFADGDIPVTAEQLAPFVSAVDRGCDVALNNIKPYLKTIRDWDGVSLLKEFLNHCIDRPDLSANSLTAVPHALSRKAITTIGVHNLSVPPKAQMIAIAEGLNVKAPYSVNVIAKNKHRKMNVGLKNPVSELIIGDHYEAVSLLIRKRGSRLAFPDLIRKREAAGGKQP